MEGKRFFLWLHDFVWEISEFKISYYPQMSSVFLVGRFSLYKVCLVKCRRRHFACARRLFVGSLRMLVNIFFCVGGVGGSVLL